jgi:hypothetical protein
VFHPRAKAPLSMWIILCLSACKQVSERIVAGFQRLVGPGMLATVELVQRGDGLGKQAHAVGRGPQ